jgi:serine protease AprX
MNPDHIERIFYGQPGGQHRFTQDFPVLPDVWRKYAEDPNVRRELLLTPHYKSNAPLLARYLRTRLDESEQRRIASLETPSAPAPDARSGETTPKGPPRILHNESVVLASLSFAELVRLALPLSNWWKLNVGPYIEDRSWDEVFSILRSGESLVPKKQSGPNKQVGDARLLERLVYVIGSIWHGESSTKTDDLPLRPSEDIQRAFARLLGDLPPVQRERSVLWSVNLNRPAPVAIWRSRLSVKADAGVSLFNIKSQGLAWAIIDTGIDATHPAFYRRDSHGDPLDRDENDADDQFAHPSRVARTYDFLRLKDLLDQSAEGLALRGEIASKNTAAQELLEDLEQAVARHRAIDWNLLEPFLRVPHDARYKLQIEKHRQPNSPEHPHRHGTHVAGIIAANWTDATKTALGRPLVGMCPDLEIYDLRALGPTGDEFTVMAALQFVRHLNAHKDLMVVHGVNLSMAVPHDVANFACGRTPVCQEAERLVASGVVVVAAAGNRGFNRFPAPEDGAIGDYRYISITDPGNAASVITVGATHRHMPHTYGVSYFSSRGPTGDGRTKPDLVAPGERIDSTTPDEQYDTLDGTSMAAPHVSGAAALIMARHRELIGQPERIKQILCSTATDLGREPRFQGRGMLDVLRALQSV